MSVLRDEKGNLSSARMFLGLELVYLWTQGPVISGKVDLLAIHATLVIGLLAWAAGPRGLEYFAPQASKFGEAILKRVRGTDDARKDDER